MTKDELIDFEHQVAILWENGKIDAPVHLSGGNEDQLIAIFKEVAKHDYVFCGHRNHYHALLHGVHPGKLIDEICGKPDGVCKGRARSMGFIDASVNFYSSAIVAGLCAAAVGVAWALKRARENDPLYGDELDVRPRVWCFVGDGAVDGGHFWEALNYADGFKLPIKFVVEDNNRATCTPVQDRCGFAIGLREIIKGHPNVIWYSYLPTHKHVGTKKYVQF